MKATLRQCLSCYKVNVLQVYHPTRLNCYKANVIKLFVLQGYCATKLVVQDYPSIRQSWWKALVLQGYRDKSIVLQGYCDTMAVILQGYRTTRLLCYESYCKTIVLQSYHATKAIVLSKLSYVETTPTKRLSLLQGYTCTIHIVL